MKYLLTLIEMPALKAVMSRSPMPVAAIDLGDQADHGCRGNQNRIADLQRPEMESETIRRRRYALARRALIEWSGRATSSNAASGRDWFPPVERLQLAPQVARSFDPLMILVLFQRPHY
jgi:hypothetical protein